MIPTDPMDFPTERDMPAAAAPNHALASGGDAPHQLLARAGNLSQRRFEPWRCQAEAWRNDASAHVRAHPIRSVAIAACTGALPTLLLHTPSR